MTATLEHGPAAQTPDDRARVLLFQPYDDVPVAGEHQPSPLEEPESTSEEGPEESMTPDRRPFVSPVARALDRIATSIDERAMNRIHGRALEENEARSSAAPEYIQDPLWHEDSDNTENKKEARRQSRAETLEKSKNVLKKIGRGALKTLANTGLITLGAGVLAGKAGVEGVKRGTKATTSAIESSKKARLERKDERMKAKEERQNERHQQKMERLNEKLAEVQRRAAEAKVRKAERRDRWKGRKERVVKGYESAITMSKNGKARVGRVATRTRRFGARAKAAGSAAASAAKTAWDNFE